MSVMRTSSRECHKSFVSWHKIVRTTSQDWVENGMRTTSHNEEKMWWELRLMVEIGNVMRTTSQNWINFIIRTSSRDIKLWELISKLNGIYHKNFVSWMLWELRLMNVMRTTSRECHRNFVSWHKILRTTSQNLMELSWELRLMSIMRITFHECHEKFVSWQSVVRTTSQN